MFGVGGKAWCLTNPDACNALFPYMAWGLNPLKIIKHSLKYIFK